MMTDDVLGNVGQAMLDMANTIMNNVEVAVMNKMMAKLEMQDITDMKSMVNTNTAEVVICQNPNILNLTQNNSNLGLRLGTVAK